MHCRTLLVAALLVLPATAFADVRYEMEIKDVKRGDTINNEILAKDGMVRVGARDSSSGTVTDLIYRPREDEILIIDNTRKEARRLTQAEMEKMQGMMAGMNQKMQEAMKKMPPQARAKAEEMMKKMGKGNTPAEAPEKTIRPLGSSDRVAGVKCDMYEVLEEGRKVQEFCAADQDDLEGGAELTEAMGGFAEFMQGFTKALGARAPKIEFEPVDGKFPVLSRQYDDGDLVTEARLVSARETDLDADQFDVPTGYTEQPMMK